MDQCPHSSIMQGNMLKLSKQALQRDKKLSRQRTKAVWFPGRMNKTFCRLCRCLSRRVIRDVSFQPFFKPLLREGLPSVRQYELSEFMTQWDDDAYLVTRRAQGTGFTRKTWATLGSLGAVFSPGSCCSQLSLESGGEHSVTVFCT